MREDEYRFRYKRLSGELEARISDGTYGPGEKLPSIRQLHRKLNLSMTTVHQAYLDLEAAGLVEARPKSGYYVMPVSLNRLRAPVHAPTPSTPRRVEAGAMVNSVLKAAVDPKMLPLGSSAISSDLLPVRSFAKIFKGLSGPEVRKVMAYSLAEGNPELRRRIALQTLGVADGVTADDVVITNGCTEAAALCLQAILKPGQALVIESPTHFGYLQLFRAYGITVVEAPTDPVTGVDIDALTAILDRHDVGACLLMPNFHNPLGAIMPDDHKRRLVRLLNGRGIPVIEDDIYGEVYFEGTARPSLLKTYDREGLALTCSSFSKTLAPGLRVGWVIAGEPFRERILRLKAGSNVCTSTLDQYVLARFLTDAPWERHLRRLRSVLRQQVIRTALAIQKSFPPDTRLAVPAGGSLLWVQLNEAVDGNVVYRRAVENRIAILPGAVCSASGVHRNYIRIGCGYPVTDRVEEGIRILGRIVAGFMD